jgi:alpha-galactosidase/6-phospho-beta-glucosidase family protein
MKGPVRIAVIGAGPSGWVKFILIVVKKKDSLTYYLKSVFL